MPNIPHGGIQILEKAPNPPTCWTIWVNCWPILALENETQFGPVITHSAMVYYLPTPSKEQQKEIYFSAKFYLSQPSSTLDIKELTERFHF